MTSPRLALALVAALLLAPALGCSDEDASPEGSAGAAASPPPDRLGVSAVYDPVGDIWSYCDVWNHCTPIGGEGGPAPAPGPSPPPPPPPPCGPVPYGC
jgi:hypothetical protein